jgi:thiamine biosynthesis lipoprotein
MTGRLSRRGALRVLGAGLALPLGVMGLRGVRDAPAPVQWHGEVLGALSSMTLWHPNPGVARRAIARMLVEIDRLEGIFSLYRPTSEIARLNRDGVLAAPSRDLVDVFDQSRRIADLSGGAFDPTIQPLWRLHANGRTAPDPAALDRARTLVDHRALSVSARTIRFARPGMAITLNGIAQGHITDRITDILGTEGFESAMIELGETRALGAAPDGRPFSVGLVNPQAPATTAHELPLANAALSVSGGYGLTFDSSGRHHILDPATGQSADRLTQVAVISPRAIWADALSTAIYVAGEAKAGPLLAACPGSRAILSRKDGTTRQV